MSLQKFTHDVFYNVESKRFLIVNDVLAAVTVISVLAIILETVPSFSKYREIFVAIEWIAVSLFTLEYLGRVLANKKQVSSYVFSFFGIVDLLAILPSFVGVTNLTYLKTARVLRLLQLLRMVRLAKLAHLTRPHKKDVEEYARLYRFAVRIYFVALLSAITIFGTLIYIVENEQAHFSTIPLGMIWAAKVTMGGVAQYMPQTPVGDMVTIAARFTGLALFGLLISLVGNTVRQLLFGSSDVVDVRPPKKRARKKVRKH